MTFYSYRAGYAVVEGKCVSLETDPQAVTGGSADSKNVRLAIPAKSPRALRGC